MNYNKKEMDCMVDEYYEIITGNGFNSYDNLFETYPEFNFKEFIQYVRSLDIPHGCVFKFDSADIKFEKMLLSDKKALEKTLREYFGLDESKSFYSWVYTKEKSKQELVNSCRRLELVFEKCFDKDLNPTDYFKILADVVCGSNMYNMNDIFSKLSDKYEYKFKSEEDMDENLTTIIKEKRKSFFKNT